MTTAYRLRLKDAAAAFGLSYSTIHKAVTDGDLPALRHGRIWLVRPADVEQWLTDTSDSNQIA